MQFRIKKQHPHAKTTISVFLLFLILPLLSAHAAGQDRGTAKSTMPQDTPLYLTVELDPAVKAPKLKTGDTVEGKLRRDVYQGNQELFPAGSRVRLSVGKLGRRRRIPNDHWPWVVKLFTPRHENYPTFQSASVFLANGTETPLPVSLLSIQDEVRILMQVRAKAEAATQPISTANSPAGELNATSLAIPPQNKHSKEKPHLTLVLEAAAPINGKLKIFPTDETAQSHPRSGPVTLAGGTLAQVILLDAVSASKSRPGDVFRARLIEPVRVDREIVLPEGSFIEGKVVKRTPPRMLSRAGSLRLEFTRLIIPGGEDVPIVASVAGADLDQRSHTRIDQEGGIRGDRPGMAWMLINLGVTAGTAKEADDTTQLIIEVIVSATTDASTAGVARIAGACASGLFFLTRHGRDVVIPKFTEMTIMFDRPMLLGGSRSLD